MKKWIGLFLIIGLVVFACSDSLAAVKKRTKTPNKKAEKQKTEPVAPGPKLAPAPAPLSPAPSGFTGRLGFGGGAGIVDVGYSFPLSIAQVNLNAGYGLGKNYSATIVQAEGTFKITGSYLAGLSLDYANYSMTVRNMPGISGDIAKGGVIGLGVFVGNNFGSWDARAGYSTVMGLTANATYKF